MSRIAVLLPVYAGDDPCYFGQAVKSLKIQNTKRLDVVLVLDGPIGPELEKVIENNKDCFSKIIRLEENKGLAAALNKGIEYCLESGYEYIARMDADDISLVNRFKKQAEFLKANPGIHLVGGAIEEINEKGKSRNKVIRYPLSHEECYTFFGKRDPLAHPAVMFRRSFFERAGMYDEKFRKNQDTQLWFSAFKAGCKFANLPDVVLQFRITDQFFGSRRGGYQRARTIYRERLVINRELGYGTAANRFAWAMFLLTIAPAFIRKIAYRLFR